MAMEEGTMECPFCGYKAAEGEYAMLLHMETFHAESQSSLDLNGEASPGKFEESEYIECPIEGCGEVLLLDEMDFHVELHAQEAELYSEPQELPASFKAEGPTPGPSRSRSPPPAVSSRQQTAIHAWRNLLAMPSSKRGASDGEKHSVISAAQARRLGRSQLGKYAHEDRMPDWLVSHLQKGGQVDQAGVIPVLEQLLAQSSTTKYAYLCHGCVHHVSKLKKEGGFCGYRNIQMMASYINGVRLQGHQQFKKKLPSVFQIQDLIETAWDAGINAQGRVETGGIRGTRKYIGTPEALAMFRLLEIPCDAQGFKDREPGKSEALLIEHVENYFMSGVIDPGQRVRPTNLPPIYFQHAGHSMTIVGFEKEKNGSKNLLVFDPMFCDASGIVKLVGKKFEHRFPDMALKPYRRGSKYLKKFREFEVLR
ncbi:DUF1671-domain-containing protein [Phialemonium atrogriseum]|uniref:DUF1671-domain-containing protein n=1 Tax=Phialemonium atrogriseum TaxID=1093897 RepID=A0AAJ0C5R0_9PEZI|nr:DUF1671-domain-containing protein [Phialemonium atrogriseum]KAK1770663.1 DUF1671-domain-containing protein [Phialemonium atrogriseum]